MQFLIRRQSGFTLLEMLVVLVIIGLIVSLVGPRLFTRVDQSRVQTAETQIRMLRNALETFRLDVGRFPNQQEGLPVLYARPSEERLANRWHGPYLDEPAPPDPWGNPYRYELPGRELPFALYSLGADGQPGGEDINADIGYLPLE